MGLLYLVTNGVRIESWDCFGVRENIWGIRLPQGFQHGETEVLHVSLTALTPGGIRPELDFIPCRKNFKGVQKAYKKLHAQDILCKHENMWKPLSWRPKNVMDEITYDLS